MWLCVCFYFTFKQCFWKIVKDFSSVSLSSSILIIECNKPSSKRWMIVAIHLSASLSLCISHDYIFFLVSLSPSCRWLYASPVHISSSISSVHVVCVCNFYFWFLWVNSLHFFRCWCNYCCCFFQILFVFFLIKQHTFAGYATKAIFFLILLAIYIFHTLCAFFIANKWMFFSAEYFDFSFSFCFDVCPALLFVNDATICKRYGIIC